MAVRTYNRGSWIRFALVFIPVPLVVVIFRLYLEAWHYYVLGGAFIFFAGLLYVLDDRAATRREAALKAAKVARAAYQDARSVVVQRLRKARRCAKHSPHGSPRSRPS